MHIRSAYVDPDSGLHPRPVKTIITTGSLTDIVSGEVVLLLHLSAITKVL